MKKTIKIVKLKQEVDKVLRGEFPSSITSPKDTADIFRQFIGSEEREVFALITLSTKNKVNCLHIVSIGSLNSCIVTPRETFKLAVETNAAAIIIAHNHPSQDCEPSREDIKITERLAEAGKLLGINVLDHVIVSDTGYISLKERGYF